MPLRVDGHVSRLYLSPPHMGDDERALLLEAFDSNWISPLGPHVDAFERELAAFVGVPHAVALSSGTAALHLALLVLGVREGDEVVVSTLTFAATANAVRYVGAVPVFVDSEEGTWNIDPSLLADELDERARLGRLPAAVVSVDVYGQCADYGQIAEICRRHAVPLIEDAAEALGATYGGAQAGSLGDLGVFSFNGNKIITTSGGGMLVSERREWIDAARKLSMQAREPAPHYEHRRIGYNYRLSNLLAAVGRGQLHQLPARVARRRAINQLYRQRLDGVPGLDFMPQAPYGSPTCWLTCITLDPVTFGTYREAVRNHLESLDIEARPTWKPMHLQPVFAGCRVRGGAVAARLFDVGLCLPSGSAMTDADVIRVADALLEARERMA